MNPKCLTTIFVPMQSLNFNLNPPSICQKHQKPLSYYNKYKPNNEPICLDCLIIETKEGKDSNLYVPFSNLEQEYYYQKNAFFQIIEQANNMKKYETYITNFQNLLTNYFSQFISKFLKEKVIINNNSIQKKIDFCEKKTNPMNSKDIMNILNKVENEKFILENKCADVFCQISKLQNTLIKNNEKLAESFKNLLNDFFEESNNRFMKEKTYLLSKTQSNKKKLNNMNVEYECRTNSSVPSNSSKKNKDFLTSTNINTKTPQDISQFSMNDELDINDRIKQISNFATINLNMEKERIFEENVEIEKDKKILCGNNEINSSFLENNEQKFINHEKEDSKSIKDAEELEWRKKNNDENDDVYLDHKDKINKLIEKDKNKKSVNQSFFQLRRQNYKKKPNLNKSFQKFNHIKFPFNKKKEREYNYYNQFNQKLCRICGEPFFIFKTGYNEEDKCDHCKGISEENEIFSQRRTLDYSNKKQKFGFFQKSFGNIQKKNYIPSHLRNKNIFGKKTESTYHSHFGNKMLNHSNSTFINHRNNRLNTPKPYDEHKKYGNNQKYRLNKKDNYDDNYNSNNKYYGQRKYKEKKNNDDDFEVDLDSAEEDNNNSMDEKEQHDNDNKSLIEEKSFNKTTNGFFRNNLEKENNDNSLNENENEEEKENISCCKSCDEDDNKSNDKSNESNDESFNKKEFSDKENNDNDIMNNNGDDEFETDF